MWRVWKDSWAPGDYVLLDGRAVSYTRAEIGRGVKRLRALVAAGYYVPLADGHDLNNQPRPAHQLAADLERKLYGTFGRVVDARQRPDGVAEFLCEVSPAGRDLLRRKKWVSPQLHESWPPQQPVWHGPTPTHLAVCEKPIWTGAAGQQAFQLAADRRRRPTVVQLGLARKLGVTHMADDATSTDTAAEGAGTPCPPELIDALTAAGLTIPEEVKTIDDLIIAIKAGMKVDDAAAAAANPSTAPGTEASPPAAMSADAAGRVMMENAAARVADLERRLAASEGRALKAERDRMAGRIGAAFDSGRATPVHRDNWNRRLNGAVQLSADGAAAGSIPVQLAAEVAAHEQLPAGAFWSGERRTSARAGEAPPPADADGGDDAELAAADRAADDYAARHNKKQPA